MENSKIVLCDTDIIIEFYKNNPKILSKLRKIGQQNIAISIVTAAELIYGALNKRELTQIKKDIKNLTLLDIDKKICEIFLGLMGKYSLSHNLAIPDSFIAATAIAYNFELFTLNLKDYRFIEGLRLKNL